MRHNSADVVGRSVGWLVMQMCSHRTAGQTELPVDRGVDLGQSHIRNPQWL